MYAEDISMIFSSFSIFILQMDFYALFNAELCQGILELVREKSLKSQGILFCDFYRNHVTYRGGNIVRRHDFV